MQNLVQQYLQNGGDLESIQNRWNIKVSRHPKYPNLVHFKYDMIHSPMNVQIVQQCRGMILDQEDNWKTIAWPFNKFFNHGETNAAKIDWSTAIAYEKLDGTCMYTYNYDGKLHVATLGMPDGSGNVPYGPMVFSDLFWTEYSKGSSPYVQSNLDDDYSESALTNIYELCSKYNQVVVKQGEPKLYWTGVRDNVTGQEWRIHKNVYIDTPSQMSFQNLEKALEEASKLDPWMQEGFVVCDSNFNRVKIKSPKYVVLHHNVSNMSIKKIVDFLKVGELDEFAANFPEWKKEIEDVRDKFSTMLAEILLLWDATRQISNRKEFALQVIKAPYSSALFLLKDQKLEVKNLRRFLIDLDAKTLMQWMELSD